MSGLRSRLAKLEIGAGGAGGLTTITIRGGFGTGNEDEFAEADEIKWTRHAAESVTDFRCRAKEEARNAGKKFLIFGGLPNA